MNRKILIFENSYTLTHHLLKQWVQFAKAAIDHHSHFFVALSGGKTPVEFYCKLSSFEDFTVWKNTHIFLTDERYVPSDDKESNVGMIKKNLLNYVDIPSKNIHPVDTSQDNISLTAQSYDQYLKQFFSLNTGIAPVFDLALLGLGEDGHTASLFPKDNGIKETQKLTVDVSLSKLQHQRISLTLPVINNTKNIIFIICGKHKASMVKNVLNNNPNFPASLVKPTFGQLTFFLDKEAASELSYHDSYTHEEEAISISI